MAAVHTSAAATEVDSVRQWPSRDPRRNCHPPRDPPVSTSLASSAVAARRRPPGPLQPAESRRARATLGRTGAAPPDRLTSREAHPPTLGSERAGPRERFAVQKTLPEGGGPQAN